jgi:nitroimidazol reductase NimA-like FMN-containing flavoprotein (pyridoxamine 5'-phosphate oxidase superfamily)
MLEELNNNQIELLLRSEVIGRIGCYADNRVYVVPVSYAYDGTYIYAHSKEGMKIIMMRKNPIVCFEIDRMENMANWQSVIATGTFEELTDHSSQAQAMKILIDRLKPIMTSETAQPTHAFSDSHHQNDIKGFHAVVFRIKLTEKSGRFEKK